MVGRTFEKEQGRSYFCPGRVNLIGEHIDYCGGLVMPVAISLGITGAVRRNGTDVIRLSSDLHPSVVEIPVNAIEARPGQWADHVIGVLLELTRNGIQLEGCDVVFASTLPQGAGLSSSAAISVLSYFMFTHFLTGNEPDRRPMALACQRVENMHIGVNCGIMDQYAVSMGRAGLAMLLDCAVPAHEEVPIRLDGHTLLIIDSHAPRQLAGSAYNSRREECDAALRFIRDSRPIGHLVEATDEDVAMQPSEVLRSRLRHVISEHQRVGEAADALGRGDLGRFGLLLNASHASLRDDYRVSSPQLDHIVEAAQAHRGCLGARLTGAGFGGCCIALVADGAVEALQLTLQNSYLESFGIELTFHRCAISDGVHALTV